MTNLVVKGIISDFLLDKIGSIFSIFFLPYNGIYLCPAGTLNMNFKNCQEQSIPPPNLFCANAFILN